MLVLEHTLAALVVSKTQGQQLLLEGAQIVVLFANLLLFCNQALFRDKPKILVDIVVLHDF